MSDRSAPLAERFRDPKSDRRSHRTTVTLFGTNRRGNVNHPFSPSGRLTTSIVYSAFCATTAHRPWLWYLLSAHNSRSRGISARVIFSSTRGAVVPSSSLAAVTATSRHIVSTTACLLWPLTFLWAAYPRRSPPSLAGIVDQTTSCRPATCRARQMPCGALPIPACRRIARPSPCAACRSRRSPCPRR